MGILQPNQPISSYSTHQIRLNPFLWKTINHPWELLFLWQNFIITLPTYAKLFKAKCAQNPLCPLCNLNQETHVHILRDFSHIKQIWELLQPPPLFFNNPLKSWISTLTCIPLASLALANHFLIGVRSIWLAGNKKIFNNLPLIPLKKFNSFQSWRILAQHPSLTKYNSFY